MDRKGPICEDTSTNTGRSILNKRLLFCWAASASASQAKVTVSSFGGGACVLTARERVWRSGSFHTMCALPLQRQGHFMVHGS